MNDQNTNSQPPMTNQPVKETAVKKSTFFPLILIVLAVVFLGGVAAYYSFYLPKTKKATETPKKEVKKAEQPETFLVSKFAPYQEITVSSSASVAAYKIDNDLGNIINKSDFTFSPSAKDLLIKNAFVVTKPKYPIQEFFSVYESNRYSQIPNFITTDSMVHNYHLMFDHTLKNLEEEKLVPELKVLNSAMLTTAIEQYNSLKGTDWENAAKRNVGFFAVSSKLLDSTISIPAIVNNEVSQELSLISDHKEIKESPVMNLGAIQDVVVNTPQGALKVEALKEDYSQYIPRGHYDRNDQLKAYFKSMMWYGRLTFRLKSDDEIKSAILITLALNKDVNQKSWDKIYEPINFFVGKSDDITYYQFKDLVNQAYGQEISLPTISSDKTKLSAFIELTKKLEPPRINSMPIFNSKLQPDREKEIKGFRFMGQRFTIDASVFQRLITREVGPKGESCDNTPFTSGRMLPKGLDIPAAMGSNEALNILTGLGETQYACYPENMSKMKDYISGLKTETWTQNLYWGWLYSLLPLTTEKPAGYPTFMRNLAWLRKELNTYLGSWTELKHDTILYAKQVYAELGGGPREEKDDRGYVEPNLLVYARLASLLKMTKDGLQNRGLLSDKNKENLDKMEQLALSLKTISEKELANTTLSKEEYELIRSYGGSLEHFWLEAFKDEGITSTAQLDDRPAAIVADVATDPNGQVLEEGTGYIFEIYAVVPVDGKLKIAKGGVYSYYEFPWPMSDRLTDSKWRELLKSDKAPKLPDFTDSFISKD